MREWPRVALQKISIVITRYNTLLLFIGYTYIGIVSTVHTSPVGHVLIHRLSIVIVIVNVN